MFKYYMGILSSPDVTVKFVYVSADVKGHLVAEDHKASSVDFQILHLQKRYYRH